MDGMHGCGSSLGRVLSDMEVTAGHRGTLGQKHGRAYCPYGSMSETDAERTSEATTASIVLRGHMDPAEMLYDALV